MVLASLFESYLQPLIIMASVPLATIGVVCALTLTHKPVGIGVLIGIIMLAGIVVNNAIILVDRINHLRREKNRPSYQAVIAACEDRLRPILMTSSTTILGLLPMALDRSEAANLWAPLAIAVIGGLLSSTLMTLFIVPSIYLLFEDIKPKFHR
jgi:HAE1 family hydrophobic/amphiphilic exporter-1